MIDPVEIKRVLENQSFLKVVEDRKEALTRTVMSQNTPDEERQIALADYHAWKRVLVELKKVSNS